MLFSDDYVTAYYTPSLVAQYPATVSSLVNTVVVSSPASISPSDIWTYGSRDLTISPPTASQVAEATWAHTFVNKLLTVAKFLGLK